MAGEGADTDSRQEGATQHFAAKEEDEDEPRGSNMESVQGTLRHGAVKTEERNDPRIHMMYDPRIHMMYREDLSEDQEDSYGDQEDSSEDSISESSSDDYEELIRGFPEITEVIEEERKEKERRHVEKQLRRRKLPGPISYNLVWGRGWRSAFKRMRVEIPKRES